MQPQCSFPAAADDQLISTLFRATPIGPMVLWALDAETGKPLYNSGKLITGWTHFSEPVVAMGKVFVETHAGQVYAFGLPAKH